MRHQVPGLARGPYQGPPPDQGGAQVDMACLKPGATAGPACKAVGDCQAATWPPCFRKCMGCGCVCYGGSCYDLLEFLCK